MAFKSYENTGADSNTMLEGDYEVQLVNAGETLTRSSGIPCIAFDFVVREDVDQRYKRKHIFKNFFKDDNGVWPYEKIGKIANALGIPQGQEFDLGDLIGLCCILHIKPYKKQDGTMIDTIYYAKSTEAGQLIQTASNDFVEVDDEDLPF